MAKRRQPEPIVETNGVIKRVHTGIYAREYITGDLSRQDVRADVVATIASDLAEGLRQTNTAMAKLQQIANQARQTVSDFTLGTIDDADAICRTHGPIAVIPSEIDGVAVGVCVPVEAKKLADTAARAFRQIDEFLGSEPSERDAQLFLMGVAAGRLLETVNVLPHEPDALRGKVVGRAASNGGRATAKLSPEERIEARAERDRLMELGHTKQNASRIVAKPLGVSYKTIERLK